MASAITPRCIASIRALPSSSDDLDCVVQVVDLKEMSSKRYMFMASDGVDKMKAVLDSELSRLVVAGKIQSLGLLRIQRITSNGSQGMVIVGAEVVAPALNYEIREGTDRNLEKSKEGKAPPVLLKASTADKKPSELLVKSAAQIVEEQRGNAAPAARMGISRRVYPLVSLNPYQGNWTIKVRVTNKGSLRSYKNARGDGSVFNVELTDEDGTQIQATMFNEAADKFYSKLELGKVYYISKGSLRVANKQYSSVKNDYEMTLNANAEVEEVKDAVTKIPELCYTITKIDELGPHVNGRELVDVLGVVQNVSGMLSIRRKVNNDELPKRDITIADESKKTVVVSLWNDLATKEGEKLLDMVNDSPVVLIKGLRVSDFQGVSLSTTPRSVVYINPNLPEAAKLTSWFTEEGKDASLTSAGAGLPGGLARNGSKSVFADRKCLSEIIQSSVGEDKPAYFHVKSYISFIKPDQAMWYLACQTCNRKVTQDLGSSSYWCEGCQKNSDAFNRRYILTVKVLDYSGEAWVSAFNEQAEQILGSSADRLAELKEQDGENKAYNAELKKAMWTPYVMRVSVQQTEYLSEKRQRITVRSVSAVDWQEESKHLIEEITKLRK